jgi:hypothetical protein
MLNLNNGKKLLTNINGQLFFTAIIFFIIGVYFRFEALEVVRITEWVTRDFDRAFHLFDGDYIPLAGPERNAGGRLLGPFLYFFLTIPLFFHYSYESIYVYNLILNIGSVIFFFWLIKKYFGVVTASITSILLSVNIIHLDSVGLPINPTFMLPLLFIFLWLLLKITLENKTNYIPWIFVTISLGIQMHFSMATYYLVPVVICILFKIKVPLKQIFIGVGLVGLCFLPYLIYKLNYYEPNIEITKTFFNQDFTLLQILKIISLQNVLHRINQGTSLYGYYSIADYIVQIEFLFSCISFYGLTLYIAFKSKKTGMKSCKKEITLFLFFYIPALIYEITNPPTGWHFWHYFIFIPPLILIKGWFFSLIIGNLSNTKIKILTSNFIVFSIAVMAFLIIKNIKSQNDVSDSLVRNENFYFSKTLKIKMSSLRDELIHENTVSQNNLYVEGIKSLSSKFLSLLKFDLVSKDSNKYLENNNLCLYVILGKQFKNKNFILDNNILKSYSTNGLILLNDPTITGNNEKLINSKKNRIINLFQIYSYTPNYNQPCYTNTNNLFAVGIKINNYLKNSFNINKNPNQELVIRPINQNFKFSDSSVLEKLVKTDIIFNRNINTPIQTEISILKINDKYKVRTDLLYYSWGKAQKDYFKIKKLKLKILENNKSFEFPIINSDSWIVNNTNDRVTENFSWYREFELPKNFKLKKDNFSINLSWDIIFPQNKEKCCLKFKTELQK